MIIGTLSMDTLLDFDLNKREKINDIKYINRATKGVYEFGSVFKTFTLGCRICNARFSNPKQNLSQA